LKSAGASNNLSRSIIGAIRINGGHDIVIENCDISDWDGSIQQQVSDLITMPQFLSEQALSSA